MFDRQPIGDDFTWMHSGQLGATVLNALGSTPNGQMLVMLDACLVDGFNVQTVASVTIDGSNVILAFGLPHGYALKQKITVSGSNDPLLNGSHRIVSQTTDTVTLKISGVTNTTGVVKTKVSPLGFEPVIGNSNPLIRGYRSKDPTSTKTVLHLDMSYPTGAGYSATNPARRAMVTACTGVDESGAPIGDYFAALHNRPTNPNGSLFWYEARMSNKGEAVSSTKSLSWVIIGNGKYFYFFNAWYASSSSISRDFFAFGDMDKLNSDDTYNCILKAVESKNDADIIYHSKMGARIGAYSTGLYKTAYFIGTHSGSSGAVGSTVSYGGIPENLYSGSSVIDGYSSIDSVSASMVLCPAYSFTPAGIRARMPRLMIIPFRVNSEVFDLSIVDDVLFVNVAASTGLSDSSVAQGAFAFDLGA